MKGRSRAKNHAEYSAAHPRAVAARLKQIHDMVRKSVPDAQEVMSYGMPAFKSDGRILIYFAAHEKHIGIYPAPRAVPEFKEVLARYGGGKGTIQFPHHEHFPSRLIGRIVKFRAQLNREKSGVKAAKRSGTTSRRKLSGAKRATKKSGRTTVRVQRSTSGRTRKAK